MEWDSRRKSLEKLNIKKLKSLCDNLNIKFKSKWKKIEYLNSICEYYEAVSGNRAENEENSVSLSQGPSLFEETKSNTANTSSDICPSVNFTTSTPKPKPRAKKQTELKFNKGIHKFFQDKCGCDATQPDDIKNWSKNPHPSVIPGFTAVEVFEYLVQRKSAIDNGSTRNNKGFKRAVAHDDANDITGGIEFCLVESQFLYIKSICYPSMRAESYRVVACIDSTDNIICGGACECVVGISGGCSHVGPLLLFLEKYSTLNDEEFKVSCTSKLCSWKGPKNKVVNPKRLREMSFNKPKLHSRRKLLELGKNEQDTDESGFETFDPRCPEDRLVNKKKCVSTIRDLLKIYPQSGAAHFWDLENEPEVYVDVPEPSLILEIENSILTMKPTLETEVKKLISIPALTYEMHLELTVAEMFVKRQVVQRELVDYIHENTTNQSSSQWWKHLRIGRLTSSMFGQVFHCKEKKFPTSLVDTILNSMKLDAYARLPYPILRGRKLEPIARKCYEDTYNLTVNESGLTLLEEYSFVGASGDGLISDPSEDSMGILEIKCPCSVKGTDITKMAITDITQNFPEFCLKNVDGKIQLDRKSNYYFQVLGEMGVKKLKWADFVVYTEAANNNIWRERIRFDSKFWENDLLPKLIYFFQKYIVPFLVNGEN